VTELCRAELFYLCCLLSVEISLDEATQIVFSNNKTYTETADISGIFLSTVTASFNDSPWLTLELVAKGPNRRGKPEDKPVLSTIAKNKEW